MPNVRIAYLLGSLAGLRFGLGVWVLYYLLFTDYAGIGLAEAAMMITALVCEIPTGALADALGRKRTLVLAFTVIAAGYYLLAAATAFPSLIVSLLVLTVGRAFYSGTYEALLFDSLKADGRSALYPTVLARSHAFQLASLSLACAAGGVLYSLRPALPFAAAGLAHGLGALVALFVKEPPAEDNGSGSRATLLDSGRGFRELFAAPHARRQVAPLLLVAVFAAVPEEILDDVLAVEFGFTPRQLGLLFAAVYLTAAASARLSPSLSRRFSPLGCVLGAGALMALFLIPSPAMGLLLGGGTVLLRYSLRAITEPTTSTVINELSASRFRATTLSTFTMLRTFPYVVLAYGIGKLMELWSATTFASRFGGLMLLAIAVYWVVARFRRPGP